MTVSLVQVAVSFPLFLFTLPAGALADVIDSRRLLIAVELAILAVSVIFAGHRISRTEAQGLANVSFCFFGATDRVLSNSDIGMRECEISIQRQRILTFGDALRGAPGKYFEKS